MTTPLPALLAQVDAMNDLASPFVFSVVEERIVGAWDETHADFAALRAGGDLDEAYRLEVGFDPRDATYELHERSGESRPGGGPATLSAAPGEPVGLDTAKVDTAKVDTAKVDTAKVDTHRVDTHRVDAGGVAVLTLDGVVTIAPWTFDTDGIRDSLVTFLESHGWSKRRSFFARLFS